MVKRTAQEPSSNGTKRPRQKYGRQELRQIKRTTRRDKEPEANEEGDAHHSEVELKEPQEEEAELVPAGEDKRLAYNALLTLLKSDHPEIRNKSAKKAKEKELEDIAGFNVEEEEAEDDAEGEGSEVEDVDAEEDEDILSKDPFESHFNLVSEDFIERKADAMAEKKPWHSEKRKVANTIYTAVLQTPPGEEFSVPKSNKLQLHLGQYHSIKRRVGEAFLKNYSGDLKPLDKTLLDEFLAYKDVMFPSKSYKNTTYQRLYALHVLNHVFKTRDRVMKNNEKLKKFLEDVREGRIDGATEEPELRDQGFTRPKALILLPTRNAAYELVELLIKLSGCDQQENRKRFKQEFYEPGCPSETKPADFKEMFKGNSNDFFSIGLKFTRKALKLYSSFYKSDVLIASPIGLSMILEDPKQSKRQYDFLSSIEVLVIDHANQIEMQNWDHVNTVMKYINKIPKESHGADFSRIRMWAINDRLSLLRQTLVFSEFTTPVVNSILSKSQNVAGKTRYKPEITTQTCIMNSIGIKIKQIFQRFESPDPVSNYEARFKFLINSVLPSISKQTLYEDGLLIYIPSYFDYVRIKSHMKQNTKLNFGSIDEYSSQSRVTKTRHNFQTGKIKVMLYTERLHHFRRFEIAGVKTVLIYEPPSNPLFYKELLRFVAKSVFKEEADIDLSFVKTLYSKWDAVALERIVGNERAPILCNSVNETYEFR